MSEQEIPTWKEETEQNASAGVYQENPFLFGGGIAQLMVTSDGQAYYQIFSFDSKQWTKVAVRPADMPDSRYFTEWTGIICQQCGERAAPHSLRILRRRIFFRYIPGVDSSYCWIGMDSGRCRTITWRNTDYIDWKKGKSNLTGEAFLELLEFAGEYAAKGSADSWSREEVFAAHPFNGEFTFYTFQDLQDELGDNVILGYPREKGRGIYMITNKNLNA